jgi:hypothetical protein
MLLVLFHQDLACHRHQNGRDLFAFHLALPEPCSRLVVFHLPYHHQTLLFQRPCMTVSCQVENLRQQQHPYMLGQRPEQLHRDPFHWPYLLQM